MLDFLFNRNKPVQVSTTNFSITESVSGYWHYHISLKSDRTVSFCGKQTMNTSIPLERWGVRFGEHFPKHPTWCQSCEEKMQENSR